MKQPALVTLAPVAYAIWTAPRRAAGLAAMTLGLVAVTAIMIALHDRAMMEWAFLGVGGYVSTDALAYAALMALIWTGSFLVGNAALVWLVARSARHRGLARDAVLWVWLGTAFVGVAAGLRFLGHYHLQLLPAACLLAARPAAELAGRAAARVRVTVIGVAIACASLAFAMPNMPFDTDYRPIAAYLRAHTAPDERIFVWGHFPEIYWASGRMPATRFLASGFVTGQVGGRPIRPDDTRTVAPGSWDVMFADLARHPPAYVIDLAPGAVRTSQYWPIQKYPRLAEWLARNYRRETVIDGMVVYAATSRTSTSLSPRMSR
jgi:hypothetical protein